MHTACRRRHFSERTEESYWFWIKQFIFFHDKRHPLELTSRDVTAFLNHLATQRHVAASTQSQALNALVFLYQHVLEHPLDQLDGLKRVQQRKRLPVVLSPAETASLLGKMDDMTGLMARLIYGAGLRVNECCTLRVKDVDFASGVIHVRAAKGSKDRTTPMPERLKSALQEHLVQVARMHTQNRMRGGGLAPLPNALERKYPQAAESFAWQFVFPSSVLRPWRTSGRLVRWFVSPSTVQRAVRSALKKAGIHKQASVHTLRHYVEFRTMPSPHDSVLGVAHIASACPA